MYYQSLRELITTTLTLLVAFIRYKTCISASVEHRSVLKLSSLLTIITMVALDDDVESSAFSVTVDYDDDEML